MTALALGMSLCLAVSADAATTDTDLPCPSARSRSGPPSTVTRWRSPPVRTSKRIRIGAASKRWTCHTKSQAEKDAEAKVEVERRRQEAQAQARQQTDEASRSGERAALSTITAPASQSGQAVAEYAMQFTGYPYVYGGTTPNGWDCSGFVQYVYAQFGISLPRTSGAQMSAGSPVASLAEAQPGDIIANGAHAAIYAGNGMVMNAMSPSQGTGLASVSSAFTSAYAIRRVL